MFHFFDAITNTKGDSLPGYYGQVTDGSGNIIPIYSDDAGTPVATVSGIANMAKTDTDGMLSFYVPQGTYTLTIFSTDAATRYKTIPNVPMGASTVTVSSGSAASSRALLAAIPSPVANQSAILTESGREGTFVFSSANLSAQVSADTAQGIYVAPSSDATGASGAWVRTVNGEYHAKHFGVAASNTAAANTTAAQAAINYVSSVGGVLRFPDGVIQHTGLIFKNKVQYRGGGHDILATKGTTLLYTGTGDGVQINNPINSSTAANISVEGITFKNSTVNAGKGSFADTGSTYLTFRKCGFLGSDRGLILDQSELVDITECDFEPVSAGATCGLWLLNNADRTAGASAGFTNRISVKSCQFNGSATAYGILDDGGNAHAFEDNNYNGCLHHIRAAGVTGLSISGGEFESAAAACIRFETTSLAGTGAGSCTAVYLGGGAEIVPSAGQNCVIAFSLASIVIDSVFFGNTTAVKFNGTGNTSAIYALNCHNAGGGSTFDGRATNHFEAGNDGTSFKIRTNLPVEMAGILALDASRNAALANVTIDTGKQVIFDDVSGATYQSYTEHAIASPYRYHSVVSKGGAGWQGGYRVQLNYNAGALFDALKLQANTDGTTAAASITGTLAVSGSIAVGGGTPITKTAVYAPTITPASVGAATVAEQTFTVTGLTTADKVIVNPPAIATATGIVGARVSAADTLAIRFINPTAAALVPSSGIYTVMAIRS